MSVAIAAGLLELLQIIEVAKDAKPLLDALKAQAVKGATFEEILDTARNFAVTSEADAQAVIGKAPE